MESLLDGELGATGEAAGSVNLSCTFPNKAILCCGPTSWSKKSRCRLHSLKGRRILIPAISQ